ncbi:MAG: hypothetical protein N4Q32_00150 [Neisseriaceae bacterium]|nr:hypothetical protein [Neisseriaceae bacterium PsAf]MCV2503028.1 hypothetical protein [Neisseriaceae bacterium]MCV2508840.1 hypothetical protein [Neisseriaceae bacterium]
MLSQEVQDYLAYDLGYDARISTEQSNQVSKLLLEKNFDASYSFFDYMTHYQSKCGKGKSSIGFFGDVIELLQDGTWNQSLYNKGLSQNYIALQQTPGWLFLYNKDDDSVILNDDDEIERIFNEDFDYYWPSFNHFLMYFFGLSKIK